MYLAYIDESGSTGHPQSGGSKSYTLGCVLVRAPQWAEIKANYLLRNGGTLRSIAISERARHAIYRSALRLAPKLGLKAFAIVIRKEILQAGDPHDFAWTFLMQRLERLTTRQQTQVLIVHDEGNEARVRGLARRARRAGIAGSAFGPGVVRAPFRGLLDDPVSRRSHESLFLQLADLAAYAAFRRVFPPTTKTSEIVPELMWDELADARLAEVNQRSGRPSPGIVAWPKPK